MSGKVQHHRYFISVIQMQVYIHVTTIILSFQIKKIMNILGRH